MRSGGRRISTPIIGAESSKKIKEWVEVNGMNDSAEGRERLHHYMHGESTALGDEHSRRGTGLLTKKELTGA